MITLQGPTGMFINPTSGTMPAGAATAQYCLFSPFVDSDVIGNGLLVAYGVTDWLEVAVLTSYVSRSTADVAVDDPGFYFGIGSQMSF